MMDFLKRLLPTGKIETYERDGVKRPIGKPSMTDRLIHGYPEAYSYSRFTREPVTFHRGKVSPLEPEDTKGLHLGLPGIPSSHSIDIDATYGDVNDSLSHEQLHHVFPFLTPMGTQHKAINRALGGSDGAKRDVVKSLPSGTDVGLFKRIIGLK